jgi:hypothetical protein
LQLSAKFYSCHNDLVCQDNLPLGKLCLMCFMLIVTPSWHIDLDYGLFHNWAGRVLYIQWSATSTVTRNIFLSGGIIFFSCLATPCYQEHSGKWIFIDSHKPLFIISLRWLQKTPMRLSKFLVFRTTCLFNLFVVWRISYQCDFNK